MITMITMIAIIIIFFDEEYPESNDAEHEGAYQHEHDQREEGAHEHKELDQGAHEDEFPNGDGNDDDGNADDEPRYNARSRGESQQSFK